MALLKARAYIRHDGILQTPGEEFQADNASAKFLCALGVVEELEELEGDEELDSEELDGDEELTITKIKVLLDESGIEYNAKAKRAELLELLNATEK